MKNQRRKALLPAATEVVGPASFPLGSVQSRAAARAKLNQSLLGRVRTTYFIYGFPRTEKVRIDPWFEHEDGSLTRTVLAPTEISEQDCLEIFGVRKNLVQGRMGCYIVER
jgi:hypothetical protein